MSANTVPIGPFVGINNRLHDHQLGIVERGRKAGDYLRDALNVDITNAGTLSGRSPTTRVRSGEFMHSLWSDGSGIASGRRRHADANVRGSPFGKERAARNRRLSHMGPGDSISRRSAGSRHPSTVTPVGLDGRPDGSKTARNTHDSRRHAETHRRHQAKRNHHDRRHNRAARAQVGPARPTGDRRAGASPDHSTKASRFRKNGGPSRCLSPTSTSSSRAWAFFPNCPLEGGALPPAGDRLLPLE